MAAFTAFVLVLLAFAVLMAWCALWSWIADRFRSPALSASVVMMGGMGLPIAVLVASMVLLL